jgi:hypothetical protein
VCLSHTPRDALEQGGAWRVLETDVAAAGRLPGPTARKVYKVMMRGDCGAEHGSAGRRRAAQRVARRRAQGGVGHL